MFRNVRQLFTYRLVGRRHLLALVDGGRPRIGAVQVDKPILGRLQGEVRLDLDAVGVHFLHVARREEALGRGQPDDPVVDVGIEPVRAAAQFVDTLFADLETDARVVAESVLVSQVGIAARQEVEVVQCREAVVARYGGLGDNVSLFRQDAVDEKRGDERHPLVSVHLLAQHHRHTHAVDGLPFRREGAREFHAPLVVAHDGLVAVLQDDVLVLAAHQMLVKRNVGSEEPPFRGAVLALRLTVERVHLAARTRHGGPVVGGYLPLVVVSHPRVDIAAFHADFPVAFNVVP